MVSNYRTWCEVDLDAVKFNIKQYKKHIKNDAKVLAVIKANAYGHGAVQVAKAVQADYFAVAFLDEAIELREAGITTPILILGYTPPHLADDIVKYDITATVFDEQAAKALSEAALKQGKEVKVHIKIDTGMSRIGFLWNDEKTVQSIVNISRLKGLKPEGIFTHFAKADEINRSFTDLQFERFCEIISLAENEGVSFKLKHCCNSAAAMLYPEMHLDMVRIGIAMYGCYPSDIRYNLDLKPALTFKTRVTNIKTVKSGDTISYGGTYTADTPKKIATIAVGYADGYSRLLSSKARVLTPDGYAKILGRICMDQCMIDVTNVNNINVGDEIILFGTNKTDSLPVEELADIMGTISYELLCNISGRVPRIYL